LNNQSQFFILCQSELGKRFGGYINSTFKNNSSYVRDEQSFLFSIDDKIQNKCLIPEYPFIANNNYLDFGEDDFILENEFKFYFQPGQNILKGNRVGGRIYEYKYTFQHNGSQLKLNQSVFGPAQQLSKLKILEIIKVKC
jgi:hypothetical protein